MKKTTLWLALATCSALLIAALPALAADGDDIIGTWVTPEGKSHVEIFKDGDSYSGKIVLLGEPNYPDDEPDGFAGKPRVDRQNPDKSLRSQPIVGLQIMQNLKASKGAWKGGTIYDPEKGKTYKCQATLSGDTLNLRGYVGFSMIGRTSEWTRLEEDSDDSDASEDG